MGAWSHTSFGNDDAADFVHEVAEDGMDAVANAFEVVNHWPADEYLEAPDSCVAIAAAEFVAAAYGRPPVDFSPEAAALVKRISKDAEVRAEASKAVRRVLNNSELRDLWAESEDFETWKAGVVDLIERLK